MLTHPVTAAQLSRLDLKFSSRLVSVASGFRSTISLRYDRGIVQMGSLIGMAALPTLKGSDFVLVVDGEDEEAAMKAILRIWTV